MATYLVLRTDNGAATEVEGDSMQQAIESNAELGDIADGEELVVYRVAAPAKHVRFRTRQERILEIS